MNRGLDIWNGLVFIGLEGVGLAKVSNLGHEMYLSIIFFCFWFCFCVFFSFSFGTLKRWMICLFGLLLWRARDTFRGVHGCRNLGMYVPLVP